MKSTYESSLNLLKKTFIGSEGEIWVDEIKNNFPVTHLRLLDIGIGTGESINKKVLPLIHGGYTIELHGIDPIVASEAVQQNLCCPVTLYHQTFEEYAPGASFDIVNATQSLYYLSDIENMLTKMDSLTKKGGLLISTLWSKSCILYQLYTAVFGKQYNDITAENVHRAMEKMNNLKDIKFIRHEGLVNIDEWKHYPEIQYAAMNIISRQFDDTSVSNVQMEQFINELRQYHGKLSRVNYMIIARK